MDKVDARAAVERSAEITRHPDGGQVDKLVAALQADEILLRAAILPLWEHSDSIEGVEAILVCVFGARIIHEPCGSMNLPGDTLCWWCEEPLTAKEDAR